MDSKLEQHKANPKMVEFDSTPTHSPHHHPLKPFTVGSEIEVSIDEEGFKGALFRATILKLPTSVSSSSSKKKNKALVEYKTLVTENRFTPLKEHVDALSLRPIPPDIADIGFEVGHIVDAVDKDGWWTGMVCSVLQNGGYSVFFMNPLHVMSFQRNQLRLHQDWVDGNWVLPQKMDASMLKAQLATFLEDSNILENVEPESSKNAETNNVKGKTCSINSRNDLVEKPSICDESYASFALTLCKRRRSLISKSRVSNPVKSFEERNVPTADGLKKTETKTSRGKSFTTPNRDSNRRIHRNFFRNNTDSSDKFGSPYGGVEVKTKKDVNGSDSMKEQGAISINGNRGNRFKRSQRTRVTVTDEEGNEGYDVIEITHKEASKINECERNEQLASEEKQMTPAKILDEVINGVENSDNQTKEKGLEPEQQPTTENSCIRKRGRPQKLKQEFDQQQACKNSYRRKRGRPKKLMIVPTSAEVLFLTNMEQDGIGWKPDESTIQRCVTGYKTNDIRIKSASSNTDDDDRPLLMWLEGMQSPTSNISSKLGQSPGSTVMGNTKGIGQVDALSEVTTSGMLDHAPDKNQGWPFVKNSPIWCIIDSLEVFKLIPQMPHFHPLSIHHEECREGLAIGCMLTFTTLAEKISKLQFDDTRHVFESILASLYELEQHGFNISMLFNRVNELLFIKDTQMQYLEETKQVENKVLEHSENKTKLGEESKAIEQKISEFQKRQSSIKLEMEAKDLEIISLQSHLEMIKGCMEDAKQHFERQTTIPF